MFSLLYRDLEGIEYRKVKSDGLCITGQTFQTLLKMAGPKKSPEWDPEPPVAQQEGTRGLCFQISFLVSLHSCLHCTNVFSTVHSCSKTKNDHDILTKSFKDSPFFCFLF